MIIIILMEVKKFDFQVFLQQLVPRITAYTEIHILEVKQTCIHFTVKWIITHKHKNYNIHCHRQEIQNYLDLLRNHVTLYPIRRLTLNLVESSLLIPFYEVSFDEIIYQQSKERSQEILNLIFTKMKAKKLSFSKMLCFQEITNITTIVHNSFSKHDINLYFKVQQYKKELLISFLSQWGESLPQKPTFAAPLRQGFGFPFQPSQKRETTNRRQQISLQYKGTQLITLRQLDNMGCEMVFKKPFQKCCLRQIIKVLIKFKRFVSLQLQKLDGQSLIELIRLVVDELRQGKYRIVVGNQLQLTASRLTLNTNNLTKGEVECILDLMKLPGHYQFVCYSTKQHFPAALQLFKSKPLVKFNFFLPIDEVIPLEQLLKKMQKHANQLLLKVYSYAGLLKHHSDKGYLAVNSIFYSLGQRP